MPIFFILRKSTHIQPTTRCTSAALRADSGILQPPLAPHIGLEHARIHAKQTPSILPFPEPNKCPPLKPTPPTDVRQKRRDHRSSRAILKLKKSRHPKPKKHPRIQCRCWLSLSKTQTKARPKRTKSPSNEPNKGLNNNIMHQQATSTFHHRQSSKNSSGSSKSARLVTPNAKRERTKNALPPHAI